MASNATFAEDYLTCAMCYELYDNTDRVPKGLPCLHNFCQQCLDKYIATKVDKEIPCPLCKTIFIVPPEGVSRIPTNIMIRGMLATMPFIDDNKKEKKMDEDMASPPAINEGSSTAVSSQNKN